MLAHGRPVTRRARHPVCLRFRRVRSRSRLLDSAVEMNLYLVDGEDLMRRAGPFQTLIILAEDEAAARAVIEREAKGFRTDHIEALRDYPHLNLRDAMIGKITSPQPMRSPDTVEN